MMLFEKFRLRPLPPTDATSWVARMHARPLGGRERRAFRRWLSASPDHARELLRAETVWRLIGALARDGEIQAELARIVPPRGSSEGTSALVGQRVLLRWVAAAACFTVLALAVLWFAIAIPEQRYETGTGEQRLITLADGSTVAMNTATRLTIQYSAHERLVRLERGEALFQVAQDKHRPFIVNAGTGWARAIGTRFNVLLDADSVTVVVLEGAVQVAPTATEQVSARLAAGESAAFGPGGELTSAAPERASPERIAAWREGKLRFDGWPLERALTEHNRYAQKPIRLDSSMTSDIRVSGTFRIGDTQAFLNALRELMVIQVVDRGEFLSLGEPTLAGGGSAQPGGQPSDMP